MPPKLKPGTTRKPKQTAQKEAQYKADNEAAAATAKATGEAERAKRAADRTANKDTQSVSSADAAPKDDTHGPAQPPPAPLQDVAEHTHSVADGLGGGPGDCQDAVPPEILSPQDERAMARAAQKELQAKAAEIQQQE